MKVLVVFALVACFVTSGAAVAGKTGGRGCLESTLWRLCAEINFHNL